MSRGAVATAAVLPELTFAESEPVCFFALCADREAPACALSSSSASLPDSSLIMDRKFDPESSLCVAVPCVPLKPLPPTPDAAGPEGVAWFDELSSLFQTFASPAFVPFVPAFWLRELLLAEYGEAPLGVCMTGGFDARLPNPFRGAGTMGPSETSIRVIERTRISVALQKADRGPIDLDPLSRI
jgi:hypothetical protein